MRSQHEISISHSVKLKISLILILLQLANIIIICHHIMITYFLQSYKLGFLFSPRNFRSWRELITLWQLWNITIASYTCDVIITLLLSSPLSDKRNQISLSVCIIVRKFKGIV